jgi:Tol biopolymer transport system component
MSLTALRIMAFTLLFAAFASCSSGEKPGMYKIALVPSRSGQHGIFVMNSDTSGGKLLTPESTARLSSSSWSPDGKKIIFYAAPLQDSELAGSFQIPGHQLLYVSNSAGGGEKRLFSFPVSDFEWSPDGQKLLYVSASENPERLDPAVLRGTKSLLSAVYVLDLPSGERKRLTDFGLNCSGAWSPDNAHLALSLGSGSGSDLYVVNLNNGQTRRITDSQDINIAPSWSPDGKTIAYVCMGSPGKDKDAGIYRVDSGGANKLRIFDRMAYKAAWSPDGKSVLVQSATGIYLIPAFGGQATELYTGRGRPLDAVFSPDGRKILFRSNHEDAWQLYSVDLKGGNLRRVTHLSAASFCVSPLLSKD